MGEVVFVTGTDTGVGKTWVAARVIEILVKRGMTLAALKPTQSYDPAEGPTDAEVLAAAAHAEPYEVCPARRWYALPLAPPMAADALGRNPIRLDDIVGETNLIEGLNLVEGAGGPLSPVAHDGSNVELATRLGASRALLVAEPSLGTINAVLLCCSVFDIPVTVFFNRFDPDDEVHARNLSWLIEQGKLDVHTTIDSLAGTFLQGDDG